MCVCMQMCAPVQVFTGARGVVPVLLLFVFTSDTGPLLKLELGWWLVSSSDLTSASYSVGDTGVSDNSWLLYGFWHLKLGFS